jgi:hypothetical protein
MKSFDELKQERNEQRLTGLLNQLVYFDERLDGAIKAHEKKMDELYFLEEELKQLTANPSLLTQEQVSAIIEKLNKLIYATGGIVSGNHIIGGSITADKIVAHSICATNLSDWRNASSSVTIAGGQVASNTISTTR